LADISQVKTHKTLGNKRKRIGKFLPLGAKYQETKFARISRIDKTTGCLVLSSQLKFSLDPKELFVFLINQIHNCLLQ